MRALMLACLLVACSDTTGPVEYWGDVTDDGLVNVIDAQQIARYAKGLDVARPDLCKRRGDVTADGLVTSSDADAIARYSVGLPGCTRCGLPL